MEPEVLPVTLAVLGAGASSETRLDAARKGATQECVRHGSEARQTTKGDGLSHWCHAHLLHFQLRQRPAHAHFLGAVGEQDDQAAVVLGGAAAGVSLVLGAQIQAGEAQARAGLPPRKAVGAGDAAQRRAAFPDRSRRR